MRPRIFLFVAAGVIAVTALAAAWTIPTSIACRPGYKAVSGFDELKHKSFVACIDPAREGHISEVAAITSSAAAPERRVEDARVPLRIAVAGVGLVAALLLAAFAASRRTETPSTPSRA